ncbi:MAG: CPBP family intramembrane glutamic endopeptidase [Actinomycetota bacterium]
MRALKARGAAGPAVFAFAALASSALVVVRIRLLPAPDPMRVTGLALLYGGLLGACLLIPGTRPIVGDRGRALAVVGVGAAALAAVSLLLPAPLPLPFTRSALPLAILAGVAEEALWRGVVYDAIRPRGDLVAVVVTAALFAAVHVPLYGVAVLPLDLGAGLLFGWQRAASGSWGASALTHVLANVVGTLR